MAAYHMFYRALSYQKIEHCMIIQIGSPPDDQGTTAQMSTELADLCSEIAWNEETRVVVLTYAGELPQSVGADLGQYAQIESPSFVEPIAKLKQPVIAAINADAVGLGLELALACDIRIGTEGARFGLPHIREGLLPSNGGTQRLPRLVGRGKALEMVLTGELIDAAEALRIGLINRVVASSELMNMAIGLAQDMASRSPVAVSYVKEALYNGMDLTLDQGMRMEMDLYLLLFTTEDRTEGITAFNEKRKPQFEGT
jgi:enoyl-CoA hydratase/carnithine racemase